MTVKKRETMPLPKIIVILGPTASGKTDLAIELAREFGGEIISADSRQVYKKMKIGTGKPDGKWQWRGGKRRFMVEGIPHYLMDIVDPRKTFSVADFKKSATKLIGEITKRKKIPFIVGGTGLHIWSVVDNLNIPEGKPDKKLRRSFEEKSTEQLAAWLQKIDPEAAAMVDKKNKRRLVRALEVAIQSGGSFVTQRTAGEHFCESLQIGLNWPAAELKEKIDKRIEWMWKNGLVEEVQRLLKNKYGFDLPSMSGIGYKEVENYLLGEATLEEAKERMKRATRRYVKRQLTWFRRDKRIKWIEKDSVEEAKRLIKEFLV